MVDAAGAGAVTAVGVVIVELAGAWANEKAAALVNKTVVIRDLMLDILILTHGVTVAKAPTVISEPEFCSSLQLQRRVSTYVDTRYVSLHMNSVLNQVSIDLDSSAVWQSVWALNTSSSCPKREMQVSQHAVLFAQTELHYEILVGP